MRAFPSVARLGPVAEPYSILIADDNDHDVSFLLKGFADIQVPVRPAHVRDSDSALELLSSDRKFDLVLLDYHLPKDNGEEIIRILHSRGKLPLIVVLSSALSPGQHRRIRAAGAQEVLEKPCDLAGFAVLAARLASIVSSSAERASSAAAPDAHE